MKTKVVVTILYEDKKKEMSKILLLSGILNVCKDTTVIPVENKNIYKHIKELNTYCMESNKNIIIFFISCNYITIGNKDTMKNLFEIVKRNKIELLILSNNLEYKIKTNNIPIANINTFLVIDNIYLEDVENLICNEVFILNLKNKETIDIINTIKNCKNVYKQRHCIFVKEYIKNNKTIEQKIDKSTSSTKDFIIMFLLFLIILLIYLIFRKKH